MCHNWNISCIKYCLQLQSGTPESQMVFKENKHPYIVAVGFSPQEISSFCIVIEGAVIPVSEWNYACTNSFLIEFDL